MMRNLINIHDFHGTQQTLLSICMSLSGFMTQRSYSDASESSDILKTTVVLWDLRIRLSNKVEHFPQMILGTNPNAGKSDPDHV